VSRGRDASTLAGMRRTAPVERSSGLKYSSAEVEKSCHRREMPNYVGGKDKGKGSRWNDFLNHSSCDPRNRRRRKERNNDHSRQPNQDPCCFFGCSHPKPDSTLEIPKIWLFFGVLYLCWSAIYNYYQTPELINLKRKKGLFWLTVLEVSIHGLLALGLW
jgi:hypothetical protein